MEGVRVFGGRVQPELSGGKPQERADGSALVGAVAGVEQEEATE